MASSASYFAMVHDGRVAVVLAPHVAQRLAKEEFIATAAWFFFIINLAKIPIYQWHGLFSQESLMFNVAMIPSTIGGAVMGRWLFEHIPQQVFERIVIVFTVVATLALFR